MWILNNNCSKLLHQIERLVTRDETPSNVKDITKVIPKDSLQMLLIVDDLPNVWGVCQPMVVNILPYTAFKWESEADKKTSSENPIDNHEETTDNTLSLPMHSSPADPLPTATQTKTPSQQIRLINPSDCNLYFLAPFLNELHSLFFDLKGCSTKAVD